MNWDTIKGQWKQFSGKVKEKWGNLTDDDLTAINGQQDQLVGKLQERYGYTKEKATELMLDVHRKGRAVVSNGTREEMERDTAAMHEYGLWATFQKDE